MGTLASVCLSLADLTRIPRPPSQSSSTCAVLPFALLPSIVYALTLSMLSPCLCSLTPPPTTPAHHVSKRLVTRVRSLHCMQKADWI
jgi:hypothetical protein